MDNPVADGANLGYLLQNSHFLVDECLEYEFHCLFDVFDLCRHCVGFAVKKVGKLGGLFSDSFNKSHSENFRLWHPV